MSESESITFHRCPHDRENPYVQIARLLARDGTISMACLGLLVYLLSNSEKFSINIKTVINHFKSTMGKDAVYRVVNEAMDAGYMKREDVTKSAGRGKIQKKTYKYYISESPKFKECFRNPENEDVENLRSLDLRGLEKADYKKDESSSYEEEKKEEGGKPPEPPVLPSFFCSGEVKMEQSRYDKLIEEYGQEKVTEMVEALDSYSQQKPKKFREYGCHAAVIRNWIKREQKEQVLKTSEKKSSAQSDRELAVDIYRRFPDYVSKGKIVEGISYIEIHHGQTVTNMQHGAPGFRDQVINALRKIKLPVEEL